MKPIRKIIGIVTLVISATASAEFKEMKQVVFGMDWAVCAHAVSVALQKVNGVQDVKVSLNEGTAAIKLKDGNKVDVEQVRDIIRKNGFTPKNTEVKVAGKVIERNGKPALEVNGPDVVYLLEGNVAPLKEMTGKQVVLAGRVPETAGKNEPSKLVVKEIAAPRT